MSFENSSLSKLGEHQEMDEAWKTNEIVCLSVAACIYIIGIRFHIQIINVSRKEKDATWKCDITNSVLSIGIYFHTISMHFLTILVDNLYLYTGTWFCYASKFFSFYGTFLISSQSLLTATMKYFLIVHWKTVRRLGQENVKNIFVCINIIHPIVTIALHLINRPDFFWAYDGYPQFDRCMGDPKNNWNAGERSRKLTKLHNLCSTSDLASTNYADIAFIILRSSYCWSLVILFYFVSLNVLAGTVYFKIFRFMNR